MKAILLVAGYATRLYPLTKDIPKSLLPVNGKPILNYILDEVLSIDSVDEIIVVSNDKFFKNFKQWSEAVNSNKPIKVLNDGSTAEDNRLGAIGDIHKAIKDEKIDDDTIIIAGDNLFTYSLKECYDFYVEKKSDCVVAKIVNDKETLKELAVALLDESGKVIELNEKPKEPNSNVAVFATYIYKKETIPMFEQYLKEGNKPDAPGYFVQWLYKRKDVYAYKMNGECYDVGNIKSYEEVKEVFEKQK